MAFCYRFKVRISDPKQCNKILNFKMIVPFKSRKISGGRFGYSTLEEEDTSLLAKALKVFKHRTYQLGFPTGRDSATFRDSGTGKTFLSRDKGTTGQAQNLATGRDGPGQLNSGTSRGTSRPLETLTTTDDCFSWDFFYL